MSSANVNQSVCQSSPPTTTHPPFEKYPPRKCRILPPGLPLWDFVPWEFAPVILFPWGFLSWHFVPPGICPLAIGILFSVILSSGMLTLWDSALLDFGPLAFCQLRFCPRKAQNDPGFSTAPPPPPSATGVLGSYLPRDV